MVELAAFMVVCWMGWKFVRTVWTNRAALAPYARGAGIVLLLAAVVMVTLVLTIAFGDKLSALVHSLPRVLNDPSFPGFVPSPGLILCGVLLLAAALSAVKNVWKSLRQRAGGQAE